MTHFLEIGRRKFVVGLFWQSLSRPRDLKREAAELSQRIDVDLMVLRRGPEVAQAGFAQSRDGARAGMASLAAAVAHGVAQSGTSFDGGQAPRSWLGAFELPDGGWAYFAVRDDGFLPNGDFHGTRDEVFDRLLGDYGVGGWSMVIGDPSLAEQGFHGFHARKLEDLLVTRRGRISVDRQWQLRPVQRKLPWKRLLLLAVLPLLLLGAFAAVLLNHQAQQREKALAEARARMAAKQAAAAVAVHPWPSQALPPEFVRACLAEFRHPHAGGWQLEEFACVPGQVTHAWTRGNSHAGHLLADVPDAVVDLSGDKASMRAAVSHAKGTDETLKPAKDVLVPLLVKHQQVGFGLELANAPPPPPPPPPPPGSAASAPPRPDWQTFTFVARPRGVPPQELAQVLALPGVRTNKLAWRQGEWILEGVIYAK